MDIISLNSSSYNSKLVSTLDHFKAVNSFVDVTLVCEGHSVKAHKIVLSAGSNVLHRLLLANPAKHPIIILTETKYDTLRLIMDFLYKGKIKIRRNDLKKLLAVAATFEINELKRLCEENLTNQEGADSLPCTRTPDLNGSSARKKRQRLLSSDSEDFIDAIIPKEEIEYLPCNLGQPEVSATTDCIGFLPQIADTRSLNEPSVGFLTGNDFTVACFQTIQNESGKKDASTECDILTPLKLARDREMARYYERYDDSESDSQNQLERSMKRKRSRVWEYYTALNSTYAFCKLCRKKLSYRTTVSNLKKHLLKKHWRINFQNPPKLPDMPLLRIQNEDLEFFEEIDLSSAEEEEAAEDDDKHLQIEEIPDNSIPYEQLQNEEIPDNIIPYEQLQNEEIPDKSIPDKQLQNEEAPDINIPDEQLPNNEAIDEVSDNSESEAQNKSKPKMLRKRTSKIWEFFTVMDADYAACRICHGKISYRTTISNLGKHILKKHKKFDPKNPPKLPDVPLFDEMELHSVGEEALDKDWEPVGNEEENEDDVSDDSESEGQNKSETKGRRGKKRSAPIWGFFTVMDASYAACKICHGKLSYRTTVTNLKKHILKKHKKFNPDHPPMLPDIPLFEDMELNSAEEEETTGVYGKQDYFDAETQPKKERKPMEKRSKIWEYFTIMDPSYAACRICHGKICYRTTSSNLEKHIVKVHKKFDPKRPPKLPEVPIFEDIELLSAEEREAEPEEEQLVNEKSSNKAVASTLTPCILKIT